MLLALPEYHSTATRTSECGILRLQARCLVAHTKTNDIEYVRQFLGHKSVNNTETYVDIQHTLLESASDELTVRVAEKPEETNGLLEVGFKRVDQKDSLIFLRKRK